MSALTATAPLYRHHGAEPWTFLSRMRPAGRPVLAIALGAAAVCATWTLPAGLEHDARIALCVTALAIIGWTLTPVPDSVVAVSAALVLVLTGVVPETQLYATLGREIVWLLVAAFVIAAVVRSSGLMERLAFAAVRPFRSLPGFFHALALVISLTAFLIPSTSGRAALLLPVFMALADQMPGKRSARALALLFPTVILLSAGGSIIGAGAHMITVESINRSTGISIGYVEWLMLAFPLTLLSSHIAVALILVLFVPRDERRTALCVMNTEPASGDFRQRRVACVLVLVVALWIASPWHGIDIALIAIGGAVLLLTGPFTSESPKQIFRKVEVELLIFLTATVVIADSMILSGTSQWMAQAAIDLLPRDATDSTELIVVFLTLVAVLSHLVINSRSARAAVLLPALTLPLAGFGHDIVSLALVTVLGTGFCQTMMASAKPVALFGNAERETFTQSDLLRLAIPLLPVKAAIIVVFALLVWPHQLPTAETPASEEKASAIYTVRATATHHDEARCSQRRLRTLMLSTIRDEKMWSAGWWHVWDRLRRNGYFFERDAVRTLYRDEDMVRLRSHSPTLHAADLAAMAVASAAKTCLIRSQQALPPERVPIPMSKPVSN